MAAEAEPNVYDAAQGMTGSVPKEEETKKGELKGLEVEMTHDGGYIVHLRHASHSKDMFGGHTIKRVAKDKKDLDGILDEALGLSDAYEKDGEGAGE